MKINVLVRPGASVEKVEKLDHGYKIWVREAPEKGMANKAVTRALASELGVSRSRLRVVLGRTSSKKVIEVI